MTDLEAGVRELIAASAHTPPAALALDADLFMDLGIDSLEGLKLLAAFERRYGVTIPDHELLHLHTPRQILAALERAQVPKEVS